MDLGLLLLSTTSSSVVVFYLVSPRALHVWYQHPHQCLLHGTLVIDVYSVVVGEYSNAPILGMSNVFYGK